VPHHVVSVHNDRTRDRCGRRPAAFCGLVTIVLTAVVCSCHGGTAEVRSPEDVDQPDVSGAEAHIEGVGSNQIKISRRDYPGVFLGSCADPAGGVLRTFCSHGVPIMDVANTEPGTTSISPCALHDERFGQTGRLVSFSGSSEVAAPFGGGQVKVVTGIYSLVYDWARSVKISLADEAFVPEPAPAAAEKEKQTADSPPMPLVVQSADYGVALRLILEVTLKEASGELDLTIGIAKLAAALATQTATVNARFLALGVRSTFLPAKPVRIDSVADLYEVLDEFHQKVHLVAGQWEMRCKHLIPTTVNEGTPPPGAPTSEANSSQFTTTIAQGTTDEGPSLVPVMLSYYVSGYKIGLHFEKYEQEQNRCRQLLDGTRDAPLPAVCHQTWPEYAHEHVGEAPRGSRKP